MHRSSISLRSAQLFPATAIETNSRVNFIHQHVVADANRAGMCDQEAELQKRSRVRMHCRCSLTAATQDRRYTAHRAANMSRPTAQEKHASVDEHCILDSNTLNYNYKSITLMPHLSHFKRCDKTSSLLRIYQSVTIKSATSTRERHCNLSLAH